MCRAWDEAMNTQPNLLTWNVMGELRLIDMPGLHDIMVNIRYNVCDSAKRLHKVQCSCS